MSTCGRRDQPAAAPPGGRAEPPASSGRDESPAWCLACNAGMARTDPQDTFVTFDQGPAGFGWTMFAGTMLLLASFITGLWGLTALLDDSYVREGGLLIGSATLWGIVLLCVATAQGVSGLLVYAGNRRGAILGLALASVNFLV